MNKIVRTKSHTVSKFSKIYTKWCAQTFPPIFRLFAILDRNFAKIVAPPSDKYENSVVKGVSHFLIQRIVFPTACTEKFGLIYRRAVSQQ